MFDKLHKASEGTVGTGHWKPSLAAWLIQNTVRHTQDLLPAITLASVARESWSLASKPSQGERSKEDTSTCLYLLLSQKVASLGAEPVDLDQTLNVLTVGDIGI